MITTARGKGAVRIVKLNYDLVFSCIENPIVLNYQVTDTTKGAADASNIIRGEANGDVIDNFPKCSCGHLRYGYRLGKICPKCNTEVTAPFSPIFDNRTWIKVPDGVSPFINPGVWASVNSVFKVGKSFAYLDWLVKPGNKDFPAKVVAKFESIYEEMGRHPRNWNYISDHFESICYSLAENKNVFKSVTYEDIERVFKACDGIIRVNYLNALHSSVYALESGANKRIYGDCGLMPMIEVARLFTGIETPLAADTYTDRMMQNKAATAVVKISRLFSTRTDAISKKEGPIRQGLTSTRCHFTVRSIIVGQSEDIQYDQINMAWAQAIHVFEIHLLNKLLRLDWSKRRAISYLRAHELKYCPLLAKLFEEILKEAGPKGFPVYFIRYPSLSSMSIRMVYVGKIKDNVNDHATDIPSITVVPFNADFDGDQMAIALLLDRYSQRAFMGMEHHKAILNAAYPRAHEGIFNLPAQVTINIHQMFLHDRNAVYDRETGLRMIRVTEDRESANFLDSLPTCH